MIALPSKNADSNVKSYLINVYVKNVSRSIQVVISTTNLTHLHNP